jgi:hypothetical protein
MDGILLRYGLFNRRYRFNLGVMKTIEKKGQTVHLYDPTTNELNRASEELEELLKDLSIDFIRERTSYTLKYLQEGEKPVLFLPQGGLTGYGPMFVKKVKDHFSGLPEVARISESKPFYEYFRNISAYTQINDVVEIDLNRAYWEAAKKLGYIQDALYSEALSDKISKKARLISLGVLGKKTEVTNFEWPYMEVETKTEYAPTRIFWENIVFELGQAMREIQGAYLPHVYGIWFDAIFCTRHIAGAIRKRFERLGYTCKMKELDRYIITPRQGVKEGAKITRIYRTGEVKQMDISYRDSQDIEINTFEDFLGLVTSLEIE